MTFLSPLWLLAAGAGIVPVLIHLIFRRRYVQIDWAAIRFLRNAFRKKKKRLAVQHLLLMFLRILFLLVMAVICAVPVFKSRFFRGTGTGVTVIILDNSYSTGMQTDSVASFTRARRLAVAVAEKASRQGRIVFIPFAAGEHAVEKSTFDLPYIRRMIQQTEICFNHISPHTAFEAGSQILEEEKGDGHTVYVITDLQKITWDFPPESLSGISFRRLAEKGAIRIIDMSPVQKKANCGIQSLDLTGRIPTQGKYAEATVLIRNYSDTVIDNHVCFRLEGGTYAKIPVSLKPGLNPVSTDIRFNRPGLNRLEACLDEDVLPGDNRSWVVVDVPSAVEILAVNGETSVEPMKDETDFFKKAMNPRGRFSVGDDIAINVTDVNEIVFRSREISGYDIIVLANVMRITEQKIQNISSFLAEGGSLVISAGDMIDRRFYNSSLYGSGKHPLLPVRLGQAVLTGSKHTGPQKLDLNSLRGIPLAFMKDFREAITEHISFYTYFRIQEGMPKEQEHTQTILRFRDGTPAVVISREKGLVCFLNFTLDEDWTDFPSHPLYLPFMRELVNYCMKQKARNLNGFAGEPVSVDVPAELGELELKVIDPDGSVDHVVPLFHDSRYTISRESAYTPGVYCVQQGDFLAYRARNPRPEEGDLEKISREMLTKRFPQADMRFIHIDAADASLKAEYTEAAGGGWRLFALIACIISVLEYCLAWISSK